MPRQTRYDAGPGFHRAASAREGGGIYRVFAGVFAERQRGIGFDRRMRLTNRGLVVIDCPAAGSSNSHGDVVVAAPLALPAQEISPRQARRRPRHQSDIAMQIRPNWERSDPAEDGTFAIVGIRQHASA